MSAIDDMMRVLSQPPVPVGQAPTSFPAPGPTPSVMSSAMPQFQPPPMQSPHTGLLDRVKSNISGLLGHTQTDAPAGYGGILSDDEIQSAKPGIGTSILGRVLGLGTDVFTKAHYGNNLNHLVELNAYKTQQRDKAIATAQEQKHAALREQVGGVLANETMDPHKRYAALTHLLGTAYSLGDEKAMGAISAAMQSAKPTSEKPLPPHTITTDRGIMQWNPTSGKFEPTGFQAPAKEGPSDHFTSVTGTDPETGKPTIYTLNTRTGQLESSGVGQTGKNGKGASDGQMTSAMYAARMSSAEKLLSEFESKGAPTLVQEAVGRIPGVGDLAQNALQNPDQQRYRQAQEDWVRAKLRKESGAAIGVKEMQDEINTYFSKPNDSPELKAQKRERRIEAVRLLDLSAGRASDAFNPSTPKGSGSASVPDYEAWKKSKGHK